VRLAKIIHEARVYDALGTGDMKQQARLLLTGFEPFDRFGVNPSWEAAKAVAEELGPAVAARRLAVDFHRARQQLIASLDEVRPEACLCMGLAAGDVFRLERVARNVSQFSGIDGVEQSSGNWPWELLAETLSRLDVPWRYSDDCGLYVCESTYWSLLQYAQAHDHPKQCGFLHVPAVSDVFPLDRTIEIVRQVVREI
jgi:pyroglutamyl-peptidase